MFSASRTKQPLMKKGPEEGSCYICYTYIDTMEKVKQKKFDLDKAVNFFSYDRIETSPKYAQGPFSMMMDQCIICNHVNFEISNQKCTDKVKRNWNASGVLPDEIVRYVMELNISQKAAQELYQDKKFKIIGEHIVSKRQDIISIKQPNWKIGNMEIIELEPELEEKPHCRIM
jgi:hypothetical protein